MYIVHWNCSECIAYCTKCTMYKIQCISYKYKINNVHCTMCKN